jgi:hypothetical protein
MFNVLEGDGVIENIYHFLWTKDTIFNTDPYVIIPQTILYKYQKPCYWYFTSKVDNKLKKKSTVKVTTEHIREVFTKHISKSGIVAYYIYKKSKIESKYETDKPNFEKTMKHLFDKEKDYEDTSDNSNSGYIIEYFDLKRFDEFLKNKYTYEDGILQKFEDPKGDYNVTYRLTWSPKLCLFEKCSNTKKINDKRYDIYEKAVTYEGEEFQIKTEPLKGSNLPDRIEKIGMSIANHVSNITLEKIKIVRMILNFKIDKRDRVLFLWCSSLRIENGLEKKNYNSINSNNHIKAVDMSKISLRTPENINIFKYSINGKPIQPHKDAVCLNCGQKVESYRLYEISFGTLIESHDNRKRDKDLYEIYNKINMTSSGVEVVPYMENKNGDVIDRLKKSNYNNFIIPKVINEIYPKMKFDDYFNLKKDSIFCAKTTCVCDSCYLDLTKYCTMGGANIENILKAFKKEDRVLPKIKIENKIDNNKNNNNKYNRVKSANIKFPNKISKMNSNKNKFNQTLNINKKNVNFKNRPFVNKEKNNLYKFNNNNLNNNMSHNNNKNNNFYLN